MTALPVVCVSKSRQASSACSSRQRCVKSRSTSTFQSAMNSAHSAWPCFENVHDPTSVTCRRREIRADVDRDLTPLADETGGAPGAYGAHGRGTGVRRRGGVERLVRALAVRQLGCSSLSWPHEGSGGRAGEFSKN